MKKVIHYPGYTMIAIMLLSLAFASCKKDDNADKLSLPPQSSFVMDYSLFDGSQKSASIVPGTKVNWFLAATTVSYWSVNVALVMALPTASFVESFNHKTVYDNKEKNWTWSYNFAQTHKAELTGMIEGDSAKWEMRIDDKLWYTGKSALDHSGGKWYLKKIPADAGYWLHIDWDRSVENAENIRYTIVAEDDTMQSSYIEYGKKLTGFNLYYNLFNISTGNLVEIEWNNPDFDGRIKSSVFVGFNDWKCWDTEQHDVACSE